MQSRFKRAQFLQTLCRCLLMQANLSRQLIPIPSLPETEVRPHSPLPSHPDMSAARVSNSDRITLCAYNAVTFWGGCQRNIHTNERTRNFPADRWKLLKCKKTQNECRAEEASCCKQPKVVHFKISENDFFNHQ